MNFSAVASTDPGKGESNGRAAFGVATDALLGAACGVLYGAVFGGFGALVHGQTWRLIANAGTCAFAGFALVALASAWQRSREKPETIPTILSDDEKRRGRSDVHIHGIACPDRVSNGARGRTLTAG